MSDLVNGATLLPLTAENMAMLLAAGLALAFEYVPSLRQRFGQLAAASKRRVMAELLALLVCAVALGNCMGWVNSGLACNPNDLPRLAQVFLAAAASNQATHLLTKISEVTE